MQQNGCPQGSDSMCRLWGPDGQENMTRRPLGSHSHGENIKLNR